MSIRTYESTPPRRCAFLGLGVMGHPMAGYTSVVVWMILPVLAQPAITTLAASAKALAIRVVCMVFFSWVWVFICTVN